MAAIGLSIEKLLVDYENPRIGTAHNQRDALQRVLDDQGEKLYALAEDIVDNGMSPIDNLLVMPEKSGSDRFIVLEGNRRAVALKILANPHVLSSLEVKPSLRKRLEALAPRFDQQQIEPVSCFEVDDRVTGTQWIYLRHTGENEGRGVVGWSGLAASRFRGGDPALQALDFVRTYGKLNEEQRRQIGDTFPITTLDRLLSTREVRDLLGVEVSDRKLCSGLPPDELIKPMRRMVLDLAEKKVNVSQLKNKTQQVAYVKGFSSVNRPDLSKIGTLRAIEEIHGSEFKSRRGHQALPKRRISDPSERRTLVPKSVRLNVQDNKVAAIFKELKSLKVEEFPHAVAVLIRVFLELSVDCYMDSHNMPLRFKHPKTNTLVEKKLKGKVAEVVNRLVEKEGCDRRDFKGVVRALSVEHSPLYIDTLHAYLHNRFVTPKTRDLLAAWDDAQRFFERVWP